MHLEHGHYLICVKRIDRKFTIRQIKVRISIQFNHSIFQKVFVSPLALENHRKSHKKYKCQKCETWFQRKDNLDIHEKKVHNMTTSVCSFCNKEEGKNYLSLIVSYPNPEKGSVPDKIWDQCISMKQ